MWVLGCADPRPTTSSGRPNPAMTLPHSGFGAVFVTPLLDLMSHPARVGPNSNRCRQAIGQIGPRLPKFGHMSAGVGRHRGFPPHWPIWVDVGQLSAEFGKQLVSVHQHFAFLTNVGRSWPELVSKSVFVAFWSFEGAQHMSPTLQNMFWGWLCADKERRTGIKSARSSRRAPRKALK